MEQNRNLQHTKWIATHIVIISIFLLSSSCSRDDTSTESSNKSPTKPSLSETVYPKSTVNIRSGPGTTYSIVRKADKGEELPYTMLKNDWYKLKVQNGKPEEWVHKDVVITYVDKILRDDAQLALLKWSWSVRSGYVIAEGVVENVSDKDIQNIKAVVAFRSRKDKVIVSGSAEVKPNPIRSGKTGSFTIKVKHKKGLDHAGIDFFYLSDKPIEWYEADS